MRMKRLALAIALLIAAALLAPLSPARAAGCPSSADPATFMSTRELYRLDEHMADLGPRSTGSPAHKRFVDWLDRRMERLPGMRMQSVTYDFDRWEATGEGIALADGRRLRVASPVPYSKPTGGEGVRAPLTYVPTDTAISEQNARGRLVVRDFPPASVPNAAFTALEWWSYDPELTLTKTIADNYTREWLSGQAQADLQAAKDAGAAGLVFIHELPYEQVKGHYAPYNGIRWGVPALWLGVDEGEALKRAAAVGESATLRLTARQGPDTTRMLIATLPGQSDERLVVASHTDGMNAVWDNGPISMLAMAEHFASLPRACRPRTLQFVFTTAHLYQSLGGPGGGGSGELEARQLDDDYNKGTVAAVMTVEHMGARNFEAVPRPAGRPGRTLVPTGKSEPNSFFFGESPALSEAVLSAVVGDDLRATIALRGADLPGPHVPLHHSFGGEGGPYHVHLVPTIAFVTGSRVLFNTAFSTDRILNPDLMRKQTLVFADILHNIEGIPREALAGGYLPQREVRSVLCSGGLADAGVAECESGVGGMGAEPRNLVARLQDIH